jgi:hypothetical protein
MKFRSLTILTLLLTAFLSGCFGFGEKDTTEPVQDFEYLTYEGTLQSLGNVNFSAKATHLLRLKGGDILYVYSDFYDLSDETLINRAVEAGGLLIPSEGEATKETLSIDALRVLDQEEIEDRTVLRETYTHTGLSFAMMVRSDWSIDDQSTRVVLTAPLPLIEDAPLTAEPFDLDTIDVRVMANSQELPIEEWFLEYVLPQGVVSPYTLSAIGTEAIPAIRADIKDVVGNSVIYYVADGSQVYIVTHRSRQDDHRLEYSNLFSDMLYSFDPLSDGIREIMEPVVDTSIQDPTSELDPATVPAVSEDIETSPLVVDDALSGTDYPSIITNLEQVKLSSLIPQSGFWETTRYEFVEPNYVYIIYSNEHGESGRILAIHENGRIFERIAAFDEGAITDWELVSGEDQAKGKTTVSVNAASGSVTTIPEGYRALESASLNFQMYYPSYWYYSRSGSFFYFSDQPADASNALVTMEIVDSSVPSLTEGVSGSSLLISVPRDSGASYQFSASLDFSEQLRAMANGLTPTTP